MKKLIVGLLAVVSSGVAFEQANIPIVEASEPAIETIVTPELDGVEAFEIIDIEVFDAVTGLPMNHSSCVSRNLGNGFFMSTCSGGSGSYYSRASYRYLKFGVWYYGAAYGWVAYVGFAYPKNASRGCIVQYSSYSCGLDYRRTVCPVQNGSCAIIGVSASH